MAQTGKRASDQCTETQSYSSVLNEGVKQSLKNSADSEIVRTSLIFNAIAYFESMAFEGTLDYKVSFTAIGIILDATGVIDYSDLKINNLTSNIAYRNRSASD